MKQGTIQDLKRLDEEIYDLVEDHIGDDELSMDESYLIIKHDTLEVSIGERLNEKGLDLIPISSLIQRNEEGMLEIDTDATFEFASKYIFVR